MIISDNGFVFGKKHTDFSKEKMKQMILNKKENFSYIPHCNFQRKIFRNILRKLAIYGKIFSPRDLKTIEIENFSFELPPFVRFCNFSCRKLNINYIKKEFLWYLKGDKYDISICEHAKMWKSLINQDGSINSNYGQYIFGEEKQLDRVAKELIKDKSSRRATIIILSNNHLNSSTNDYPCTYSINFHIREDKLNMIVRMRSQDAIFGMGNDIPIFSFIHEMLFNELKETYNNLEYGTYFHSADSFHVYERHFEMLEKITNINIDKNIKKLEKDDYFSQIYCPKINGINEVKFIKKLDFTNIPEEYKFTKWINNQ